MNVSIPYGTPASTFEVFFFIFFCHITLNSLIPLPTQTNKAVAYENLRVSVATKGVPKLFANVCFASFFFFFLLFNGYFYDLGP